MTYKLYPDAALALSVRQASGRVDTAIEQRDGAPPAEYANRYARMMFIRVAALSAATPPRLAVTADTGSPVLLEARPQAVFSLPNQQGYLGDAWADTEPNGQYAISVGLKTASSHQWKLGIINTDPSSDEHCTWVVADNPAETVQPWNRPAVDYESAGSIQIGSYTGAIATDPSTGTIYLANRIVSDTKLSIINGDNVNTMPLPTTTTSPSVAVDSRTHIAYVTDGVNKALLQVNGTNVTSLSLGFTPTKVVVDVQNRLIYVSSWDTKFIYTFNADTRRPVNQFAVTNSENFVVDPITNAIYVVDGSNQVISVIRDGTTKVVADLPFAARISLGLSPDGRVLYTVGVTNTVVDVIDTARFTVTPLPLPTSDYIDDLVVDPANYMVFFGFHNTLMCWSDMRTGRQVGSAQVGFGEGPGGMAIDAQSHRMYVSNYQSITTFAPITSS
jgi:DNA-binding beta-propeller fold protein YncE